MTTRAGVHRLSPSCAQRLHGLAGLSPAAVDSGLPSGSERLGSPSDVGRPARSAGAARPTVCRRRPYRRHDRQMPHWPHQHQSRDDRQEELPVSVTELRPGFAARAPGRQTSPVSAGDRTPPQDMAAEQSVLGAMMISKDAIADVVEVVRGTDFYRPTHEMIHDAIIDLYGRGEPADMVTVADELSKRGELQRIGGAPYLHTLLASVPIAANAALLRRDRPGEGDPAPAGRRRHQHRPDRLRRRGRGRRHRQQRPGRGLPDRRPAHQRGLRPARRASWTGVLDEIEAIGNRDGRALRRADRLRRPRRPDQRPARRPDDHRRGPAGRRQVDARLWTCAAPRRSRTT